MFSTYCAPGEEPGASIVTPFVCGAVQPGEEPGAVSEIALSGLADIPVIRDATKPLCGPGLSGSTVAEFVSGCVEQAPPDCNTGVQTPLQGEEGGGTTQKGGTAEGELKSLADWFSFTLHSMATPQPVCDMLGGDWVPMERGFHGYKSGLVCGHVMVLYDGQPSMGIHVQVTGEGCRELEARGVVKDWREFLKGLLGMGARFSRSDFAIDDRAGYLSLAQVEGFIRDRKVVSRWKTAKPDRDLPLGPDRGEEEHLGHTIYFGKKSSSAMLRMYDKADQLRGRGEEIEGQWTRVEFQARDERAQAMVEMFVAEGFEIVPRIIRNYLEFKEPTEDSHRHRWPVAEWWGRFLQECEKLALTLQPEIRTIEQLDRWIKKQIAPSIAVMKRAFCGDVEQFHRWADAVAAVGNDRVTAKHRAMLAAYLYRSPGRMPQQATLLPDG